MEFTPSTSHKVSAQESELGPWSRSGGCGQRSDNPDSAFADSIALLLFSCRECLIAAGELESERSGMERATGGGGASDKEAESATNEEAEPFAEDGRYPNDNNRAAAGSALPLAATIAVMAATGEDNEEDVEEGESGALNRDRMREGGKRAMLELEQTEGCSSAGTSM